MKDSDFEKIDMAKASEVPERGGVYEILRKHYWIIDKDGHGLLYRGYGKQCNTNPALNEMLIKNVDHPGVSSILFDTIYLPWKE